MFVYFLNCRALHNDQLALLCVDGTFLVVIFVHYEITRLACDDGFVIIAVSHLSSSNEVGVEVNVDVAVSVAINNASIHICRGLK